ncbi:MAG: T9SS type A sorting domain-containing protein [Flavobacteriaceae bacterium]|nr:T9SS type A sorting domain-containing protein [Flavobacteriaceae bacterium]
MKRVLIVIIALIALSVNAQQLHSEYHRAKIHIESQSDLMILNNLGVPTDHGSLKFNTFIESDFSESEIELARLNGFQVDIIIHDVSTYYVEQNSKNQIRSEQNASCLNEASDYTTPTNFNVWPASNFGGFYTYSQVLQELDDMANHYPNLITAPADISNFTTVGNPDNGTSPSIGGNTIKWLKISDNPNSSNEGEPQILYTSIHHAREPASLSQLLFFMWYLLENYDSDPEIQALVDNTELYFVPVVDPDGYLYNELTNPNGGGLWRKNRNGPGVDNNRNYDYHIDGNPADNTWGGPGSSSNINSPLYHGTGPFSEVENQAIKWFVEQHNFVLALNNHTFGELIYYPFGYADVPTPDEGIYQGITDLLVSQSGYTPIRDFPFSGDSDDFMYGTVGTHQKIFAMTPEIGTSFWPAQSQIESICKEMMFTNISAAQIVGNYAILKNSSDPFITSTSDFANYSIKRLGLQEPANFTVSVNPLSANILSAGSSVQHNGLNFLDEIDGQISINLDPAIAEGDMISYELILNNSLYNKTVTVNRSFGQPLTIFSEPADNTTTYWNLTAWNTTTADFVSSPTSITDSPLGVYANNSNTEIVLSDPVDLTGAAAAYLNFNAKWEIEDGFDYAQVEVSVDDGSNWIPQCGIFTNNGSGNQSGASGEPVYDGIQSSWVQESIDLSDYLEQNVLLRFKLVSDASVREDGFYFDDLEINIIQGNLDVDESEIDKISLYPNPVDDKLFINAGPDTYRIRLYSVLGSIIFDGLEISGEHQLDLSKLSAGIYILNFNSEKGSESFRIIKK